MTPSARDLERVTELLGRAPRGEFDVVVRDAAGDPVVLRNHPLLDDGKPMPTRYWLVGADESRRIGRLESAGGVDAAEAAVDPDVLADAHRRYAADRDAAMPPEHDGPRPSGGVGGTRVGVKCLHAHWAWHLAGGDDPVGRWIEQQLATQDTTTSTTTTTTTIGPATTCAVDIDSERTVVRHGDDRHEIPWGAANLTDRWLRERDPPRPEELTNALGTFDDHLDDLIRLHPGIAAVRDWEFTGATVSSLASVEAGSTAAGGPHPYGRSDAEEVFRLLATEAERDRAENPGLPLEHVEFIVATSCIVQACMRRFHLDAVTLRAGGGD